MEYKEQIRPELRRIAKKIPYNRAVIRCANIFQTISFGLTAVPKGVIHRKRAVEGYQKRKLKVDVFEPSGLTKKLPGFLYVHGGAFSYKASAYHKKLACIYAAKAQCSVYFPDYHLASKHPYPAAYEDVLALYKYMAKNAEELFIDREKIGVGGDSAGASIAALIVNHYKREDLPRPCLQMLVYPLTDAAMQTDSMKKFSDTPLWNAKNNRRMWSYYCKDVKAETLGGVSPLHSDLPQTIPDTYIETAEYDCLHDEGLIYGEKLRQAGTKVQINETLGTIHGYDSAINTPIAIQNIEKRVSFLKRGFYGSSMA